jgi:hypothetical protein
MIKIKFFLSTNMSITTNNFLKITTLSAATALSTFSIASAATIDGLGGEDGSTPITFNVNNGQDADDIYTASKVDSLLADKANSADVGNTTTLQTTATNLVGAVNEVKTTANEALTTANNNVSTANSYTDAQLQSAKTYVDNTFATKSEIANLTTNNFATKAQVTDLSNRVNKAIAMAAALDFVAPSDNKHLNVIVGSAGYKNQQAVSAGLTLRFNNVLFGVGGSFSGSESLVKGVVSISAF